MDTFSLEFIGWFYTLVCAVAIAAGAAIMLFLHSTGRLQTRYKQYSIWNDIMLMVIWMIGLAGGVGVLDLSQWGQFLLQLFCWMLIALVTTSAASRLYAAHRLSKKITISPREWRGTIIGLTLMVVPIVLFCLATIASLRTEEARRAFGIH
ncbi:MAG: hypothetical protein A3I01_08050 [Betaproteobacteria bacterium RIFCSPLOWO2_02_FULL_65_24]|nr:MAG: hypothetical protein A3I01_08050 [Betaproteobacteria bacterium RIFCSPLOWO2_02_FULL_65_24]OGA94882.1 MAG: hypothetical protein A3G27_18250 [Betaproteobacteria bacterium RIFCSPLOWO2_12_FULL_66_14]